MQLEDKHKYIKKLQAFYDEIDDDGDGEISYSEFCGHLQDPTWHAFAASLDIDTFVVGCIKLKGAAKSMDLIDLMHEHENFSKKVMQCFQDIKQRVIHVEDAIDPSSK